MKDSSRSFMVLFMNKDPSPGALHLVLTSWTLLLTSWTLLSLLCQHLVR